LSHFGGDYDDWFEAKEPARLLCRALLTASSELGVRNQQLELVKSS